MEPHVGTREPLHQAMKRPVANLTVCTNPIPDADPLPVSNMSWGKRKVGVGVFNSPIIGRDDACYVQMQDGSVAAYYLYELMIAPPGAELYSVPLPI